MSLESNSDRLSDMPEDILHHILSFLPTPDSVRTSVLSSRWLHLWRCVPAFDFDVKVFCGPVEAMEPEAMVSQAVEKINQFIARRNAYCPLFRFHLDINWDSHPHADPVSDWISYARCHGVRDMSVHAFYMSTPPVSAFFDLPSLESLDIQYVDYIIPPMPPQLIAPRKLKKLTLHVPFASLDNQYCAALLLSSCPDLEELNLYRGMFDDVVEITAPNLRRLTILNDDWFSETDFYQVKITCPRLQYLHLSISWAYLKRFQGKIFSVLQEASMDLSYNVPKATKQFMNIFMSVCRVTKLTIRLKTSNWIKAEPWCLLKHMRRFPIFHKLKRLKFIANISEDHIQQVLLRFVIHSPNLASLQVIDEREGYSPLISNACKQQLRIPASLKALDHLQIVSVKGIIDEERQNILKMLSEHVNAWERVVVIT